MVTEQEFLKKWHVPQGLVGEVVDTMVDLKGKIPGDKSNKDLTIITVESLKGCKILARESRLLPGWITYVAYGCDLCRKYVIDTLKKSEDCHYHCANCDADFGTFNPQ